MTSKPYCQAVGTALSKWGTSNIYFYNKVIPASDPHTGDAGILGGDIHPANHPKDPYRGQIHIYKNNRSTQEWLQTLRHEAAHANNSPDGQPVNTTNPYEMNAEQVATYCS